MSKMQQMRLSNASNPKRQNQSFPKAQSSPPLRLLLNIMTKHDTVEQSCLFLHKFFANVHFCIIVQCLRPRDFFVQPSCGHVIWTAVVFPNHKNNPKFTNE